MANQETMISIDSLSLAEQMEVGMVTRLAWPIPIEQVSQEELMELGLATKASWEAISPTEMQGFWAETLGGAYREAVVAQETKLASSVVKSWADQVSDCDEIDWQDVEDPLPSGRSTARSWSEVAWGRCHCGCEEERSQGMRFGRPSNMGM